jgi:hypothetical protein
MCSLDAGVVTNLCNELREIWNYREASYDPLPSAIGHLRELRKSAVAAFHLSGEMFSMENEHWIKICCCACSMFTKRLSSGI